MATTLLPCPFCGSAFKIGQEPHDNHPVEGMFYIYHDYGALGSEARKCRLDIRGHFDTEDEAFAFWNRRASAALSIEQTQPAGEQWCAFEDGHQHTSWYPDGYGDRAGWEALAKRNPVKYQIVTRPLYAHPPVSALVNAQADADVVERWQPMIERLCSALDAAETYVIDGVTNAKQQLEMNDAYPSRKARFERELRDAREIFAECQASRRAAISSLRPAEVGSAIATIGGDA